MQSYRILTPAVYQAETRLHLVQTTLARDADTTAAEVAAAHGCSRAQLYKLVGRVRAALVPTPPGPVAAAYTVPTTAPAATASQAATATLHRGVGLPELVCTLAVHNVSIRGMQAIFTTLGVPRPAGDSLVDFLRRAGRAARRLLARARGQVRATLHCLAGDDIFFHRTPIKVVLDPVSGALLDVQRWPWHAAEDWDLFLAEWPALHLWVSDLGTDLVGAAAARSLPHQADYFHECAWWTEHVFGPLSRREGWRAAAALTCWERATRPDGPGRRLSPAKVVAADAHRATAEADFFTAVEAEDLFRRLLHPLAPEGQRWTDARVTDLLAELRQLVAALPPRFARRVWRHLHKHRARWCAHRVLWERIEVTLRDDTAWTRERVLDAVVALRWATHRQTTATTWPQARAAQAEATALRSALDAACANAATVVAAVASLIEHPRRSSSLVEALNSRLRVLQMVHRNVSDHLLALVALAWNLSPRTEGRRKGPSPYVRLGIDFADDTRPWYEVLLEEMEAD
jgi:hypothetical protein